MSLFFENCIFATGFAAGLLESGPRPRNGNKSDHAHPPIHPTKYVGTLQVCIIIIIIVNHQTGKMVEVGYVICIVCNVKTKQ